MMLLPSFSFKLLLVFDDPDLLSGEISVEVEVETKRKDRWWKEEEMIRSLLAEADKHRSFFRFQTSDEADRIL